MNNQNKKKKKKKKKKKTKKIVLLYFSYLIALYILKYTKFFRTLFRQIAFLEAERQQTPYGLYDINFFFAVEINAHRLVVAVL